jgi:hypothetical protein
MDFPESDSHSFIVKIWREEAAEETERAAWRGHITHVPSGERRYVKDLDGIVAFVVPYLEHLGANIPIRWRLRRWLKRWTRKNRTQINTDSR